MISLPELARRVEQPTALRILHQLPLMLSTRDWLRLDQRALGHMLRRSQPTISLAMSELMRCGAVARTGRGPGVRYRLADHIVWESPNPDFHNGSSATMAGNVSLADADQDEDIHRSRRGFQPRTAAEFRHDELQAARELIAKARTGLEGAVQQHSALVKAKAKASDRRRARDQVEEAEATLRSAIRHMEATRQDLKAFR